MTEILLYALSIYLLIGLILFSWTLYEGGEWSFKALGICLLFWPWIFLREIGRKDDDL
jgi:hypothetical protein